MVYFNQPKHLVAVDCVIFGYEQGELKLLLCRRNIEPEKGKWSLLGGFLNENESLEHAARRVLHQISGLMDVYLQQVFTFSEVKREPDTRVISAAFVSLIPIDRQDTSLLDKFGARWHSVNQLPPLIFDHPAMVASALEFVQRRASYDLVGRELLPFRFTFTQLRNLYEAIFQKPFDPGNFRKKILSLNVLDRTEFKNTTESKRGAFYYQFKYPATDNATEQIFKNTVRW